MKRLSLLAALAVAACGSTSSTGATLYTIGGTVGTGAAGLVLTTDAEPTNVTIALGQNAYTFATGLQSGTAYDVTVKTQPSDATCTVANPQGTVEMANVTNINVTCVIELP